MVMVGSATDRNLDLVTAALSDGAWRSISELATATNLSRSTVERLIRQHSHRFLSHVHAPGRSGRPSSVYQLDWVKEFLCGPHGRRICSLFRDYAAGKEENGLILFVGSGLSRDAGYPSMERICTRLREGLGIEETGTALTLEDLADRYVAARGRTDLSKALDPLFAGANEHAHSFHQLLLRLPWRAAATVNYDPLLENAALAIRRPLQVIIQEDNLELDPRKRLPLYKVHGSISRWRTAVVSGEDYRLLQSQYPALYRRVDELMVSNAMVFLGFNPNNPHLIAHLKGIGPVGRERLLRSYCFLVEHEALELRPEVKALLDESHISVISYPHHGLLRDLFQEVARSVPIMGAGAEVTACIARGPDEASWQVTVALPGIPKEERTVAAPWQDPEVRRQMGLFRDGLQEPAAEASAMARLEAAAGYLRDTLARTLFPTGLDRVFQAMAEASKQGIPLPLRIVSSLPLAHELPWELVGDAQGYWARDNRVDVLREAPVAQGVAGRDQDGPGSSSRVRLGISLSAPEDGGGSRLFYEEEYARLGWATDGTGVVVVETDFGTFDEVLSLLADHRCQMLHLSGHGHPGQFIFEKEDGGPDPRPLTELVTGLRGREALLHLRGIMLSACYSASAQALEIRPAGATHGAKATGQSEVRVEPSSAAALHEQGIPAVVAFQGVVLDEMATRFAAAFYHDLARGGTLARAVRFGRAELGRAIPGDAPDATSFPYAWAQPTLYQRGASRPLVTGVGAVAEGQGGPLPVERRVESCEGIERLRHGFIGRRLQLRELRSRLRRQPLLAVTGIGGIGKTTLAMEYCRRFYEGRGQRVVYLQGEGSAEELLRKLVEAVSSDETLAGAAGGILMSPGLSLVERGLALRQVLAGAGVGAIYWDNFEVNQVGGAGREASAAEGDFASCRDQGLGELLKAFSASRDSEVRLVLTSRNPLRGLPHYQVSPLKLGEAIRLRRWFENLRRVHPETFLKVHELAGGLARAYVSADALLAKRKEEWGGRHAATWDQFVKGMEESERAKAEQEELLGQVLAGMAGSTERDLFLPSLWDNYVGESNHDRLFSASVYFEPVRLGALEAVWGLAAPEDALARMVSTTFLEAWRQDGVDYYAMNPMVRGFVRRRQAAPESVLKQAHRAAAAWYQELQGQGHSLGDGLSARSHWLEAEEWDKAAGLTSSIASFLDDRGIWPPARRLIEKVLGHPVGDEERAELLNLLGIISREQGILEEAERAHMQVLEIARGLGNPQTEANALGNLGLIYAGQGKLEEAERAYSQTLEIARRLGNPQTEASALGNLGSVCLRLGKLEEAERAYTQAMEIARRLGNPQTEANQLGNLGNIYADQGKPDEAERAYTQALEIARRLGNPETEANQLGNLGLIYARQGKLEEAERAHMQALGIARRLGNPQAEANSLGNLGLIYANQGKLDEAERAHTQALEIARRLGNPQTEASALGNLGIIYARQGKLEEAERAHTQALQIDRQLGNPQGEAEDLGNLGLIYAGRGKLEEAERAHTQALEIARRLGNPEIEANNLGNLGSVYLRQGKLEEAERAHTQALEIARRLGNPETEASVLGNLGSIYLRQGKLEEAERAYTQALEIARRLSNPQTEANQLGNLGSVYLRQGRLEEAERAHTQALQIDRQLRNPQGEAEDLCNLGLIYARQGKLEEAERAHTQALDIARRVGNPELAAICLDNLGDLALARRDEARLGSAVEKLGVALLIYSSLRSPRSQGALASLVKAYRAFGPDAFGRALESAWPGIGAQIGGLPVEARRQLLDLVAEAGKAGQG